MSKNDNDFEDKELGLADKVFLCFSAFCIASIVAFCIAKEQCAL